MDLREEIIIQQNDFKGDEFLFVNKEYYDDLKAQLKTALEKNRQYEALILQNNKHCRK